MTWTRAIIGCAAAAGLVAAGCDSTGEGAADGAADGTAALADGATAMADASSDAPPYSAECAEAGGACTLGNAFCGSTGPQDCGAGGWSCCLPPPTCTDGEVMSIQASAYDPSCAVDSDCVAVGVGTACYPCALACANAAIRVTAHAQYLSDLAKTYAAAPNGCATTCIEPRTPCCHEGKCQLATQCLAPGPTDAATDAASE